MSTADTVHGRIDHARATLTPTQIGVGLALVLVAGFAIALLQEPLMHDSFHNFRHAAGLVCH
jgi:hypothetical protein